MREAAKLADGLTAWIRGRIEAAGGQGAVFGLSGGIDSSVVGALCARAYPQSCLGLIMPCRSDPTDAVHARMVADRFSIPTRTVDLSAPVDAVLAQVGEVAADPDRVALATANLKPRFRMCALYYFANALNYLVVGTGNRSELAVGYFTKYGDGGVDLLPLADLVKSQVRELALHLEVPGVIIEKPPSAGLWAGQTDEREMGLTYRDLDRYLLSGEGPREVTSRIEELAGRSRHKLRLPEQPDLSEITN
ncbi:MAG: NAD(+) synthase [Firmicutes bacterium]|nr:NAD(+) synthase [Bacillota bacterium]